jgi:hypothetical protein
MTPRERTIIAEIYRLIAELESGMKGRVFITENGRVIAPELEFQTFKSVPAPTEVEMALSDLPPAVVDSSAPFCKCGAQMMPRGRCWFCSNCLASSGGCE